MSAHTARPPRPPRAARPPVPPSPTFEALDATHRQVVAMLQRLQHLVDDVDRQGVDLVARKNAADICDFFDQTARAHHAAEDQFVFPGLLVSGDAALVQHVQRLQQDHGWLEEDWRELQPQLLMLAEGYNGFDLDFLRAAIPIFTDLYRDHIFLEEAVVYPESRRRQA